MLDFLYFLFWTSTLEGFICLLVIFSVACLSIGLCMEHLCQLKAK